MKTEKLTDTNASLGADHQASGSLMVSSEAWKKMEAVPYFHHFPN